MKMWAIDTEYAHGEAGALDITPFDRSGYSRIGPDLVIEGSIQELVEAIVNGEAHQYLKENGYDTKITHIYLENVSEEEVKELKDLCAKNGIEAE